MFPQAPKILCVCVCLPALTFKNETKHFVIPALEDELSHSTHSKTEEKKWKYKPLKTLFSKYTSKGSLSVFEITFKLKHNPLPNLTDELLLKI